MTGQRGQKARLKKRWFRTLPRRDTRICACLGFTEVTRSMALASHDSDFLYEVSRSTNTTSRLGNQYKEVQDWTILNF